MSAQHSDSTGRGADFDALADLFLGEPERGAPALRLTEDASDRADDDARPLVREVLLLGHLPVRANPWVAQYARLCAEREGVPVALIRMGAGQMGIDLYGMDPDFRECQAESTSEDAIERVARMASHVILQVSDEDDVTLATCDAADRVTVLTAANDAAVVSVYRTAKRLAGLVGEIGVAVMGESETRARAAVAKLAQASRAFLDLEIVERGIIDRMGPTGGAMVFLGECESSHEEIAVRLAELREPDGCAAEIGEPIVRAAPEPEAPVFIGEIEPRTVTREAEQHAAVDAGEARVDRQQVSSAPRAVEDARGVAMTAMGLTPIGASCPDDEGVTLARDEDGAVHLLVADEGRRGMERLASVRAWAGKHARLLCAIDPKIETGEPMVLHLLTARPRDVRHLLECEVKIHALRRADERIGTGWVCLELN